MVPTPTSNMIPNADFVSWPNGLFVPIQDKLSETAAEWLVDFRKGTSPKGDISLFNPADMGLKVGEYALRLSVHEECTGYLRLIVRVNVKAGDGGKYFFSGAFRRPNDSTDASLRVTELFLGKLDARKSLVKERTIKKNLGPKMMARFHGIPVEIDEAALESLTENQELVLVFEFAGSGSIIIAQPKLSKTQIPPEDYTSESVSFEDTNIQSQIKYLKLSPIWRGFQITEDDAGTCSVPTSTSKLQRGATLDGIPFVQIVIPVFNAAMDLNELLASIFRNTASPFEVILSDDCSGDFAARRIDSWLLSDPRVKHIRHKENVGYTRNINIALQSTVSEFVVLINSDTLVPPRWLERMINLLQIHGDVAAVGPVSNAASWQSVPLTKAADGGWAVNMLPPMVDVDEMDSYVEELSTLSYPRFPLLNGFCTVFRKSALDEVGYFDDENFPQGYGEENDLCLRLGYAGWNLRVADDTYVFHKKSKSFDNDRRSILSKRANSILKSKHPEVKFTFLEEEMRTAAGMVELRRRLIEYLRIEMSDVVLA